jgi:hypothetical protein
MSETTRRVLSVEDCEQLRNGVGRGPSTNTHYVLHKALTLQALLDTIDDLRERLAVAETAIARIEIPLGPVAEPQEPPIPGERTLRIDIDVDEAGAVQAVRRADEARQRIEEDRAALDRVWEGLP